MKYIRNFVVDSNITSLGGTIKYTLTGDQDAVFSLTVKKSNGNLYNFSTGAFSATTTSQSRLYNQYISRVYRGLINIPAASSGETYTIDLFAEPHFETRLSGFSGQNNIHFSQTVSQSKDVYVRLGLASDQDSDKFNKLYNGSSSATYASVTGSSDNADNKQATVDLSVSDEDDLSGSGSQFLGYKVTAPSSTNKNPTISDSLQPRDSDFYTEVTGQTNGSGTDSTSMIVDDISNLVVDMSLVDIADSSDEEQSGTLGVLTYPKITAINPATKTLTLSAAPDWGDNKAVKFRAYGRDLIKKSSGVEFNSEGFKFSVTDSENNLTGSNLNGQVRVNGAVSGSTSIATDYANGYSVGSKLIGGDITTTSSANVITAIHASGTPITVTGNQTLADNVLLYVYGSTMFIKVTGTLEVTKFGTADTVIYLDIDRAFVLGTTS